MGNFDWQLAVAIVIVAAAVLFLGRRVQRLVKGDIVKGGKGAGCGTSGCGSCSASAAAEHTGRELPLVTLDQTAVDEP